MKYIIALLFNLTLMAILFAQQTIPLYNHTIPNSKPSGDEEKTQNENGIVIVSKISIPTLTIFLPPKEKSNGTAVVICPGGGYVVNAIKHEGYDVAKNSMRWEWLHSF